MRLSVLCCLFAAGPSLPRLDWTRWLHSLLRPGPGLQHWNKCMYVCKKGVEAPEPEGIERWCNESAFSQASTRMRTHVSHVHRCNQIPVVRFIKPVRLLDRHLCDRWFSDFAAVLQHTSSQNACCEVHIYIRPHACMHACMHH